MRPKADGRRTGEFIKNLREKNDMTQEDLASKLCVSRKTVSKWETGGCFPSIDTFWELANLFGVTIEDLLIGKINSDTSDLSVKN